jgi:hypothetical protein
MGSGVGYVDLGFFLEILDMGNIFSSVRRLLKIFNIDQVLNILDKIAFLFIVGFVATVCFVAFLIIIIITRRDQLDHDARTEEYLNRQRRKIR